MTAKRKFLILGIVGVLGLTAAFAMRGNESLPRRLEFVDKFPNQATRKTWDSGHEELIVEFKAPVDQVREEVKEELASMGFQVSFRDEWHKEGEPLVKVDEFRKGPNHGLFLPFTIDVNPFTGKPETEGVTCQLILSHDVTAFQTKTTGIRRFLKRIWPFSPPMSRRPDAPVSRPFVNGE